MRTHSFMFVVGKIWQGQTLTRILMNVGLSKHVITGRVIDVGGARNPDYYEYFQKRDAVIESVDGMTHAVDFEKDRLPYDDGTADTVVSCNVLEHIYHHRHLALEMYRILKPGGRLIGFVPFLIQYHPDPHDYFRYTHETLERLLADCGFKDVAIERTGKGPFFVMFNTIILSLSRIARVVLYPFASVLDAIFIWLRPKAGERFPIGYIFTAQK